MNREKFQRKDWYKLDLSAIVYPTLQRRDFSSVYRLSVLLKEEINPKVLQQALDMTLPRFPTYKAAIRKGLFWRYLEPNDRPGPFVQEDVRNTCQPMNFKANNRYLIRVYYFRNRISMEAHHSLGDGTGGMALLLTMTATYLRLLGWTGAGYSCPAGPGGVGGRLYALCQCQGLSAPSGGEGLSCAGDGGALLHLEYY